jgi:hypothetical protein
MVDSWMVNFHLDHSWCCEFGLVEPQSAMKVTAPCLGHSSGFISGQEEVHLEMDLPVRWIPVAQGTDRMRLELCAIRVLAHSNEWMGITEGSTPSTLLDFIYLHDNLLLKD